MTPINIERPCPHAPDEFKRRAEVKLAGLRSGGPGRTLDLSAVWDTQLLKCNVSGSGRYEKDMGILGKPSGHLWVNAVLAFTTNGTVVLSGTVTAQGDWESKAEAKAVETFESMIEELVA